MWDNPRQLNSLALVLTIAAAAILASSLVLCLARLPAFAVKQVIVQGDLQHINTTFLRSVIRGELSGNLFTLPMEKTKQALKKVPWVREVVIRRLWPHSLEIVVQEHKALARWNDQALVNTFGEVFQAEYENSLPLFNGPEGTAAEITERFLSMNRLLADLQLKVDQLWLSSRRAWRIKLSNGLLVELGREQVMERLQRWLTVYPRTVAGQQVNTVDLRYRNGFAAYMPLLADSRSERK